MELARCFFTPLMLIAVALGDYVHNVSVHVLDPHVGKPALGVKLTLHKLDESYHETFVTAGTTNTNGRVTEFSSADVSFTEGMYKLRFNTKEYFTGMNRTTFYPFVDIVFEVEDANVHHHIPLLLNAYSYTTYRGPMKRNLKGNGQTEN